MKVFISSPQKGLRAERAAVRRALTPDYEIEAMEGFGSSGLPSLDTCQASLRQCRACILILGPRYGTRVPGTDISYTEAEYEEARDRGIKVCAYVCDDFDAKVDSMPQSD